MLCSSCQAQMSPPKHMLFTFRTKVRTVQLSFLATYHFQAHASWLSKKPSCSKILLTVCMQPVAITLNDSVENIRNDVCQNTSLSGIMYVTFMQLCTYIIPFYFALHHPIPYSSLVIRDTLETWAFVYILCGCVSTCCTCCDDNLLPCAAAYGGLGHNEGVVEHIT